MSKEHDSLYWEKDKNKPAIMTESRNIEETKVCDDNLATLQEYILGLKVLVNDAPCMEVAHTLKKEYQLSTDVKTNKKLKEDLRSNAHKWAKVVR